MTNLRDLKTRQRTTHLIKRMTGAMGMIARARYTTTLGNYQHSIQGIDPLKQLASELWQQSQEDALPLPLLCAASPLDKPWLLVVLSSNSGLCGGFNSQLIARAKTWLSDHSQQADVPTPHVLFVGKKARRALDKDPRWVHVGDSHTGTEESWIEYLREQYVGQHIRGCYILYSRYVNAIKQEPCIIPVLPMPCLQVTPTRAQDDRPSQWHTEPTLFAVLEAVTDRLFHTWCQSIELEHQLSEHAARMQAMTTAHDNAKDMLQALQIQYNRLRQDRITKEIIEIVAGAQAGSA